ncbi:hepatocyte growth factor-regulated tyrosine kinase substrate [Condylostylus longicornis]|uniref:hepatocyte growth factor-regulated tyrosine kinase substrate n=1 Tax=Condylostylus longicornis TaxID=2530218 RepID=UPI00244E31E5|nr:hepatocyte growth factor-regulated tyrosine kinase substrate [Condylostylus longicornis]
MFGVSYFDKNLENATSHLHLEPDWPSILLICDAIRQNDISAKQAFQSIKKKMSSPNPHSAYYALLVLESVVKNCGTPMHDEIFTKENCEMFSNFIEETPHENVRQKLLELVQTWAYAFRSSEKYQSIKDTMTILKAKGHIFPELKEADAMFTADTAPGWADGKVCHRCRVEFSFTIRKHHCRNCGQIFCGQCSSKQCPLPKFGIEKEVRVCDGCYANLQKPQSKRNVVDTDLPAEYLNSTLAQQPQNPPRKSEQELKEEEELQLALALSQSEAEQKNKEKSKAMSFKPYKIEEPSSPKFSSSFESEEQVSDPELAKYLNRNFWEQKKSAAAVAPASPSAPSPMPQQIVSNITNNSKLLSEDEEMDDFAINMKTQVEIFVNRMKSNSSRGRNIANDTSVQTLFMNITSLHSQLLTYIKKTDDKRMWCEQLQDKLNQVKDSRAALDLLRQEHAEKLRRAAEEQERQRQLQMAQKLEIMRKKKQEYLQYQRQLALQRIQEQEREMQIRQEQQKAQYRIGQSQLGYIPSGQPGSPNHQMNTTGMFMPFGFPIPGQQGPINQYPGSNPPPQQNVADIYANNSGIGNQINSQMTGVGHNIPQYIPQGNLQNMHPPNIDQTGNIDNVNINHGLNANIPPGHPGMMSNPNLNQNQNIHQNANQNMASNQHLNQNGNTNQNIQQTNQGLQDLNNPMTNNMIPQQSGMMGVPQNQNQEQTVPSVQSSSATNVASNEIGSTGVEENQEEIEVKTAELISFD